MLNDLTQTELKKLLHYNPETGTFTWLPRTEDMFGGKFKKTKAPAWNAKFVGSVAGCASEDKRRHITYIKIRISGTLYQAHRLVWLYLYGRFPEHLVDHEDRDGTNNKIKNLREATNAENMRNGSLPSDNTSGFVGVWWSNQRDKWVAELRYDKKKYHLGTFKTKQEAIEARKAGNIKFGFSKTHGRD